MRSFTSSSTALLGRIRREQDGQGIVELALAMPVLLLVVIAIVDFGRAVNYWNDENHIANLGARYAAVGTTGGLCGGTDYSTAGHTLQAYLQCEAGIDSPSASSPLKSATICISAPSATVGSQVTVKISTQYSWIPWPSMFGGSTTFATTTLAGNATMRLEQVPSSSVYTTTGSC